MIWLCIGLRFTTTLFLAQALIISRLLQCSADGIPNCGQDQIFILGLPLEQPLHTSFHFFTLKNWELGALNEQLQSVIILTVYFCFECIV